MSAQPRKPMQLRDVVRDATASGGVTAREELPSRNAESRDGRVTDCTDHASRNGGCPYCAIIVAEADADPRPPWTEQERQMHDVLRARDPGPVAWMGFFAQIAARPEMAAWRRREDDRDRRARAVLRELHPEGCWEFEGTPTWSGNHCLSCHGYFWKKRDAVYCSNACRQRAYRRRRAEA